MDSPGGAAVSDGRERLRRTKTAVCTVLMAAAMTHAMDHRAEYAREIGMGREIREAQQDYYAETRRTQAESGRDVIDAEGVRVRVEQYLLRPAPNQVETRIFNSREGRTDQFSALKTFNKALPEQLSDLGPTFSLESEALLTFNDSLLSLSGLYLTEIDRQFSHGDHRYREWGTGGFTIAHPSGLSAYHLFARLDIQVNGVTKVELKNQAAWPYDMYRSASFFLPLPSSRFADGTGGLTGNKPTTENNNEISPWQGYASFLFDGGSSLSMNGAVTDPAGNLRPLVFGETWTDKDYFNNLSIRATEFGGDEIRLLIPLTATSGPFMLQPFSNNATNGLQFFP